MNAHVERFNRTIQDEFLDFHKPLLFKDIRAFSYKLLGYLLWFNTERVHFAFGNKRSPLQFIASRTSGDNPFLTGECKDGWTYTRSVKEAKEMYSEIRYPLKMFCMPTLPNNPTIKDFQQYVVELEQERGFTNQTPVENCLLLGEEVGELFKAVRKHGTALRTDSASRVGTIEEELADIIIYLCAVANRYGVDLEKAFREKEEVNKKRVWQ